MSNNQLLSEQEIRKQAQAACDRHPYGFGIASVDDNALTGKPGFSVTIRQPGKPGSVSDKEWWDAIVAIRNDIEQIHGVTRVYLVVADRAAST
jgi:hypothetical protein